MSDLPGALRAWREIVGVPHLIDGGPQLAAAHRATFATHQQIPAIVRPATRAEVQACVQVAQRHRIPLFPISTGKNWGYGSRVPVESGCALLDLGRMQRIVAFDEQLAYLTVEPGVTFRQALAFLAARGSRLMLNLTGSSLDTSLIGNALERGIAAGRYADRWASVCGLEVVLPDGSLLETGYSRFAGAHAGPVARWGVGPDLDGLFAQSNLGIVTRMTLWLPPTPQALLSVAFTAEEAQLGPLIDALQALRLDGAISSSIHLYNTIRLMGALMQHPLPEVTLGPPLLPALRQGFGIPAWLGWVELPCASPAIGAATAALLTERLAPHVVALHAFNGQEGLPPLAPGDDLARLIHQLTAQQSARAQAPTTLGAAYWRKRRPPPADMDPDRDGCGVLWFAPALPFTGAHVGRVVEIVTTTCAAHAFEPHISIVGLTERMVIVNTALIYDREEPGADERAAACHEALLRAGTAAGYLPYRLSIHAMGALPAPTSASGAICAALKAAFDPHDILAPGRYVPRAARPAPPAEAIAQERRFPPEPAPVS